MHVEVIDKTGSGFDRRWITSGALVMLLSFTLASSSAEQPTTVLVAGPVTTATSDGTPVGWRRRDIKGQSRFAVVEEGQKRVLRVESKGSASGLFREVMADPKEFPVVRWSWKVSGVVTAANEGQKGGDDAAARVFVLFKDPLPSASRFSKLKHRVAAATGAVSPGVALCYIWSNRMAREEVAPNAYTDWVGVIAAEQGPGRAGQWIAVQRNLIEDFRRAFGTEPKQVIGIAVMTDTDDTGGSVTAFYSDITFHKEISKPGTSVGEPPLDLPSLPKPSSSSGPKPGTAE